MEFHKFATLVNDKFEAMQEQNLFTVDIDKDSVYTKYLDSFAEGTNPIYIERTEHDCSICKNFIRTIGNVVTINEDYTLDSVWNIPDLEAPYAVVAKALHEYVTNATIVSVFVHNEPVSGKAETIQLLKDGSTKKWQHFHATINTKFYERDMATVRGKRNTRCETMQRAVETITQDAVNTVMDLIESNAIYRGAEFKEAVTVFNDELQKYKACPVPELFGRQNSSSRAATIRNSVIGSLLVDLSEGVDVESAVKSFEAKVAPSNYKRPQAVVTEGMKKKAIQEIDKMGIRDSISRRHAVSSDVSINNVLFADRATRMKDVDPLMAAMGASENTTVDIETLKNLPEISIEDFLTNVLPNSTKVSIATTNTMTANQVHISAPVVADAPNILQWDNNFSWSYNGNVADSGIAKNVKKAGGAIDGFLRFSIQWNEEGNDVLDLDAHCAVNSNFSHHIMYDNRQAAGGTLDIDIQRPTGVAVENITWPSQSSLTVDGVYDFYIQNYDEYTMTGKTRAELAIGDTLFSYTMDRSNYINYKCKVASVTIKDSNVVLIKHHAPYTEDTKAELVPVNLIMLSPNYWDNNASGNKHYMFMTDSVKTTEPFRGFYNEFLDPKLHDIRKAFDMLADAMRCEPNDKGLRGYGFSSTKPQTLFIKVDNKFYNVKI